MCDHGQPAPAPTTAAEALAAVHAGLRCLAGLDAARLTPAEQADTLRSLAAAESVHVAATASVLAGFNAQAGYTSDGQGSVRAWLRWQTQITPGAAAGAVGWMRRLAVHREIAAALADGRLSPSWARQICDWTDRLRDRHRAEADQILLDAAAAGCRLTELSDLAEQIHSRCAPPDVDPLRDGFTDRSLQLTTHFRGAATLRGDLTPECAAALRAVLETLGRRVGAEDLRNPGQRRHDALEEACRRLIAAGALPGRAGQPTHIQLQMTLSQLLGLDGAGPDIAGGGWACAAAPPGADCDATITPIVIGTVDHELLDKLAGDHADVPAGRGASLNRGGILARAIALLSGPGGLAAQLRTGRLPRPAASISLPLDVGKATETIPPQLRRAIVCRDRHCRFPGCESPAEVCQVHHIIPRSMGGVTSLANCLLLCAFHHLIAIHRWGWTITLHPDGSTSASSDVRTLHSHAPPAVA